MTRGREIVVGLVIIAGVAVSVFGTLWLQDASFGRGTRQVEALGREGKRGPRPRRILAEEVKDRSAFEVESAKGFSARCVGKELLGRVQEMPDFPGREVLQAQEVLAGPPDRLVFGHASLPVRVPRFACKPCAVAPAHRLTSNRWHPYDSATFFWCTRGDYRRWSAEHQRKTRGGASGCGYGFWRAVYL